MKTSTCRILVSYLFSFLLFGTILVLFGCEAKEAARREPPPPPPAEKPIPDEIRGGEQLPSQHFWALLGEMDGEESGYGMYTYVLFGRRVDVAGGLDSQTRMRYEKLLEAIAASTLAREEAGELSEREKLETNLIQIPAIASGKTPSISIYNSPLALRYLAEIGRMLRKDDPQTAERLTTGPGPFLVSSLNPLGKIGPEGAALLYADLSTTHPDAMAEVISAYKLRISRQTVSETERFAPLRLSLLNLVLNADENVRLVRAALAEWVPQ